MGNTQRRPHHGAFGTRGNAFCGLGRGAARGLNSSRTRPSASATRPRGLGILVIFPSSTGLQLRLCLRRYVRVSFREQTKKVHPALRMGTLMLKYLLSFALYCEMATTPLAPWEIDQTLTTIYTLVLMNHTRPKPPKYNHRGIIAPSSSARRTGRSEDACKTQTLMCRNSQRSILATQPCPDGTTRVSSILKKHYRNWSPKCFCENESSNDRDGGANSVA